MQLGVPALALWDVRARARACVRLCARVCMCGTMCTCVRACTFELGPNLVRFGACPCVHEYFGYVFACSMFVCVCGCFMSA